MFLPVMPVLLDHHCPSSKQKTVSVWPVKSLKFEEEKKNYDLLLLTSVLSDPGLKITKKLCVSFTHKSCCRLHFKKKSPVISKIEVFLKHKKLFFKDH